VKETGRKCDSSVRQEPLLVDTRGKGLEI